MDWNMFHASHFDVIWMFYVFLMIIKINENGENPDVMIL
jgi:hypothetical protein